jgi:hypothetical protein
MNGEEQRYLDLLAEVLERGARKTDRTQRCAAHATASDLPRVSVSNKLPQ